MKQFDHIDDRGKISMIDTTGKPPALKRLNFRIHPSEA